MVIKKILPVIVFFGVGNLSSEFGLADCINYYFFVKAILLLLLIEVSILLQFKISKGEINAREYIVKAALPICVIGFLSCFLNHLFGYGRTLGTLGYKKQCGVLTLLGISDDTCIVLLFVFYLVLLLLIYILLQMRYAGKKTLIRVSIMICLFLSAICLVIFYTAHIFVSVLLLLSFVYLYCLRIFLYLRSL